jgi:hypothetical protein
MQNLKEEIDRYVKDEMEYGGELAGNIKTAIKVRLENLCVGSKGYTFNTYECIDIEKLLESKAVFELEGFADDSDKAFCVGLLVIFINEYRQVMKEMQGSAPNALKHLLVIEEAHRLLKNIDTERSSENMGNPKGKAVEHFTNMIAEMRSYGQGVIVAEQIPGKLAPDVIKNSSNKLVQRIVSYDDQQTIANTIGIKEEDAIQIGILDTGYALAHKEGMAMPVLVKISRVDDIFVSDEQIYNKNKNRAQSIALSIIRGKLSEIADIKKTAIRMLNTLAAGDYRTAEDACFTVVKRLSKSMKLSGISVVHGADIDKICAKVLSEYITHFLICGVYKAKALPQNDLMEQLEAFLFAPSEKEFSNLKALLTDTYGENAEDYITHNIAALIRKDMTDKTNIPLTLKNYFITVSPGMESHIQKLIERV